MKISGDIIIRSVLTKGAMTPNLMYPNFVFLLNFENEIDIFQFSATEN